MDALSPVDYEKETDATFTDSLTGLLNHGFFRSCLDREIKRSAREATPLGLAIFDIDWFSSYNLRYGFLRGDKLLKDIAGLIRQNIRECDLAARYRGDVFAILFIKAEMEAVRETAKRICLAIEEMTGGEVTASVGLASCCRDTGDNLIPRAKEALSRARITGRNNVHSFESAPHLAHQKKPRVLVVDDDPVYLKCLEASLRVLNYDVIKATDGQEALRQARTKDIDLIMLDIMMPGMDGHQVCRLLKGHEATRLIPVVLLTALNGREDRIRGIEAGADDFMSKPPDKAVLHARTQSLIRVKTLNQGLETNVAERTAELAAMNYQLRAEIEERKKIELALRESEGKFKELADLLPQAVFEMDGEGTFSFLNQAAFTTFELRQADFENGLSCLDLIAPEDRSKVRECNSRILNGEKISSIEITALKKSGGRFPAALYPIRDIFLRRCDRIPRHFYRSQRTQENGGRTPQGRETRIDRAACGGIAHEINTPAQYAGDNVRFLEEAFRGLERVMELYEALRNRLKAGEAIEDLVAEIEAAVEDTDLDYARQEAPKAIQQSLEGIRRISKIVLAMKEFSHPGPNVKTETDLNKAIESTVTVARNEWKYVADVVTNLDPCLPLVPCLPGEVNQVVLNMIINAAHAIAEKQAYGSDRKGTITISTLALNGLAEISISDTGSGIPENIRSKIFDPFFTTKEVGKGTGQGLAISHSVIVDKHGGAISFESEPDGGTTFFVRLPLACGSEKL